MKKRLIIHIGLPKTGSSALQFFFAQNAASLAQNGVDYRHFEKEVLEGAISSGNASKLIQYLVPQNRRDDFKADKYLKTFEKKYLDATDAPIVLLSSEVLHNAAPACLADFFAYLEPLADVTVIAFIRNLYGHTYSSWMQGIKRGGETRHFSEYVTKCRDIQFEAVRNWSQACPDFKLIHYDSEKDRLLQAFFEAAGLPLPEGGQEALPRINRSLNQREATLLRELNRMHRGELSRMLSDALIVGNAVAAPDTVMYPGAAKTLEKRFSENVDWINENYFPGPRMQVIGDLGASVDTPRKIQLASGDLTLFRCLIDKVQEQQRDLGRLKILPTLSAPTKQTQKVRRGLLDSLFPKNAPPK